MNHLLIPPHPRDFIRRYRHEPRLQAMVRGWIAQATCEAEDRYPERQDDRERTHFAVERAITLAMSFVFEQDGEMAMVRDQLDAALKNAIKLANITPPAVYVAKDKPEQSQ